MSWELRGDLRADPAGAPGERNIEVAGRRRSIWPSIAVAAAATAFGGVIWFAYQNGRDDSRSGAPPLVKAEPGPVKIKPDNPGGQDIPFQDSTVYERLAPNGPKPAMEKLLPPPEAPVDRPAAQPATAATVSNVPDDGSPTALAPSPGSIVVAPSSPRPTAQAPNPAAAPPTAAQTPPKVAMAADPIAALIATDAKPSPAAPAGGYRIRLSAVRSADSVAREWARLKRRYPELAALKSFSSKTEQPGRGVFYRVEAGPLDAAQAKSTCDHLRAEGLGCIVVKP